MKFVHKFATGIVKHFICAILGHKFKELKFATAKGVMMCHACIRCGRQPTAIKKL